MHRDPIHRDVESIRRCAIETRFSGVARAALAGDRLLDEAFGSADRRSGAPNQTSTRFGVASGTKGFTALTVMSLVEDGSLALTTTARSLLDADLPLIDDRVTIEHLLAHRSGIGDYLDESIHDDATEYVMPIPVHRFATTAGYLPALDGHQQMREPGEAFAYNNAGFVVLALLVERVTGRPFHDVVSERVFTPAGMVSSGFPRSDELPVGTAIGYLGLDSDRTNVLHLPVVGSGDGGAYSTLDDIDRFWSAFASGAIVDRSSVERMTTRHSVTPSGNAAYGLGFWLSPAQTWWQLEGADAGVSFMSRHDPSTDVTWTVISNTTDGAWPLARLLSELSVR